ncbi:thiamine biosynthesis protein ThiF [Campylobacter sp. MIT 21-1685]|uniref:thiamine biosynthesis protein ThiF n=1 Tax=unclassified Campylobacter TaxID=2593542 RepID=UPI00224B20E9|nr:MULTISPECIES: thiamine biosynthesis protein ThiF [unclassified Campylobacter]MCX2683153.1 thiamine biosynthesis protein ThiF [Campylobacter sp. MIT 21-1684]MCX2751388.1 thiamine biosynthesis protein ThiF [Campylobacter sp. MIT 21-1682]MCX2807587.1 thiamine biosynthesis protein ThiF [Campylobacter sp. MIT 21-1685]
MMKIKFNGKECETACKTSEEFFKEKSQNENDVWIINGFATKEKQELKDNDELFCIPRFTLPPKDALDAMMRARHTPKLHDKLKKACVAVCGLGGLGSHIAINLARSGIGFLKLIDFDVIEPSNLNRQAYTIDDLGKFKTEALQEHINKINPFITTQIYTLQITAENIKELFIDCDIVCEAFDSDKAKAMLAQNFHRYFEHTILICASGLAGYGDSNSIQTRKIAKNFYVCGDLTSAAKIGNGLMSPRVNICAGHQANLVLELLAQE